ncbi:hypothetical protein [Streptomyces flavofungini]|uniref:hypothetical protein n=1 Tax=Streptomyces flavofungini TaxID=68200 RepID=UPI0025B22FAB|nr:hypothetical protein [Streptomyces flavofungini]WJV51014.1 hypothetical protein QUY26_39280 [Streptomyces flavofungini]
MGKWAVIVQYSSDVYRTEFLCQGLESKVQALEALREALCTYVPSKKIVEKRRRVYRFVDQETYLVVITGKLTQWECTLRIAELVSDSAGPAVAKRVRTDDGAAGAADGPQDRIPPGY